MSETWGKGTLNNTIGLGQGACDNTINWGKSQKDSSVAASWSGDTDISGCSGAAGLAQIDNLNSMCFDGASDFLTISNPISLPADFTWSAWIYPTRVDDSYEMIYTQGDGTVPAYFAVQDTKLHVYITGIYQTNLGFINANEWQHVAVTRTSGVLNLYKNGVEYNGNRPTKNGTVNNNSDGVIGKWYNSSHYFKGNIDEVGIFNVALTEAEILSIYNATAVVDGVKKTADLSQLTTPPVAWYRM